MAPLTLTVRDNGVARIHLHSGRGNPLTPAANAALLDALDTLTASPPRALVIDAGDAPIFSGGFALPIIASFPRPELADFFSTYMTVLDRILRLPCPSVTAVSGHAVAAGFILSLATDLRVVTTKPVKLGLPEVDLGVPVPGGAHALLAARATPQHALRMCTLAALIDGDEASRIGYADQRADDAVAAAHALAEALAAKPGVGAGAGRQFVGLPLADRVKSEEERWNEPFLDAWFSEPAQARILAQAARLSRSGR